MSKTILDHSQQNETQIERLAKALLDVTDVDALEAIRRYAVTLRGDGEGIAATTVHVNMPPDPLQLFMTVGESSIEMLAGFLNVWVSTLSVKLPEPIIDQLVDVMIQNVDQCFLAWKAVQDSPELLVSLHGDEISLADGPSGSDPEP